jgi:hypothetical protein
MSALEPPPSQNLFTSDKINDTVGEVNKMSILVFSAAFFKYK